jgi:head-tail adaptor
MGAYNLPPIGSLRERVRIERRQTAPDGVGGSSGAWIPILTGLPARITPLMRGQEEVISQGLKAVSTFSIWVRGSTDTETVLESDRIVNERTLVAYNIRLKNNPDERGRFWLFTAQSGVAGS